MSKASFNMARAHTPLSSQQELLLMPEHTAAPKRSAQHVFLAAFDVKRRKKEPECLDDIKRRDRK